LNKEIYKPTPTGDTKRCFVPGKQFPGDGAQATNVPFAHQDHLQDFHFASFGTFVSTAGLDVKVRGCERKCSCIVRGGHRSDTTTGAFDRLDKLLRALPLELVEQTFRHINATLLPFINFSLHGPKHTRVRNAAILIVDRIIRGNALHGLWC
jgi:hypothetical protein